MATGRKFGPMDAAEPIALIKFKAPRVVYKARMALEAGKGITDRWDILTRRICKPVVRTKCRQAMLMNERMTVIRVRQCQLPTGD